MKKQLHKHIGQGVKKYQRQFTKYLYERDTIFATIWVFLFIVILGSIPLNLGNLNPIKLSLKDFDFNDMAYSKLGKSDRIGPDSNIVIVNIGNADRKTIAEIIDSTSAHGPKVMALDALFNEEIDPYQDSILNETFARTPNLIAATRLVLSGKEGDTITSAGDYFKTAKQYAYVNFFGDQLATLRAYEPWVQDYNKKSYPSFAAAIVKAYDPEAYKEFSKKKGSKIMINYTRDVNKYQVIPYEQLVIGAVMDSAIRGKIALLAYVNTYPYDIDDKFFTPMNERFYGKSIPDMNGIVVHANIISMALEKNYIKKVPSWLNWAIAIIVCWLHMSFFIRYYLESHIWFHLIAKIAQVASAILFVWLGIYLFTEYRVKVDMKLSLLVIVLAVDVIYFYEAWATWMHKKYNYKTIFKPHHH